MVRRLEITFVAPGLLADCSSLPAELQRLLSTMRELDDRSQSEYLRFATTCHCTRMHVVNRTGFSVFMVVYELIRNAEMAAPTPLSLSSKR